MRMVGVGEGVGVGGGEGRGRRAEGSRRWRRVEGGGGVAAGRGRETYLLWKRMMTELETGASVSVIVLAFLANGRVVMVDGIIYVRGRRENRTRTPARWNRGGVFRL